ncbi:MAG: acetyl-CoA C-acetyltransferase [Caldisericia bacterium]
MSKGYILSAARTPIGKFFGTLSSLPATKLGAFAIKEAVKRAGIDGSDVSEVIMGQVVPAGAGQNPARQATVHSGLPEVTNSLTINKVCGSGLKAIMLGSQAIQLGEADVVVAGGMESMTNAPYLLDNTRYGGYRYGDGKLIDGVIRDGLWCAFEGVHMGNLAEYTAKKANISREDADEYAFNSQEKAKKALDEGYFDWETFDVEIPQWKKDPIIFSKDETPRPTDMATLQKLKPAFDKEGVITAGNAPGLSEGGAAVVVGSEKMMEKHGALAKIVDYASAHLAPKDVFFAPIEAVKNVLAKTGMNINDFDAIEANEAFAVQCLADGRELGWDWDKVNMAGGAIALGHPIGCSGARIIATLIGNLRRTGGKKGLATLCLGGGGAVAMAIELV